ncbi:DUF2993 domain-containing protein [Streptomyces sp. NPDC058274]|uniref:LmeA family phospholipid-binding protein n=1 Tax=Streptomyces sp. NPDC058274 TaxID=3346416 RepID=UPI0036E60062
MTSLRARPRARGALRGWRKYVVAAVALAGMSAAADRAALAWTEHSTADAFQDAQGLTSKPEVTVHGFPVLTQLAGGTLDRVDIEESDIPAGQDGRRMPVTRLKVRLDRLRRSSDASAAHAASAEATAFVSYRDLSEALGLDVRYSDDSRKGAPRIEAGTDLPLVGEATASARVAVAGADTIAFRSVRVEGALPASLKADLSGVLERELKLDGVPAGLALKSLTTTPDGLTATLSGKDVTFHTTAGA